MNVRQIAVPNSLYPYNTTTMGQLITMPKAGVKRKPMIPAADTNAVAFDQLGWLVDHVEVGGHECVVVGCDMCARWRRIRSILNEPFITVRFPPTLTTGDQR